MHQQLPAANPTNTQHLINIGFQEADVTTALHVTGQDFERALDYLLRLGEQRAAAAAATGIRNSSSIDEEVKEEQKLTVNETKSKTTTAKDTKMEEPV